MIKEDVQLEDKIDMGEGDHGAGVVIVEHLANGDSSNEVDQPKRRGALFEKAEPKKEANDKINGFFIDAKLANTFELFREYGLIFMDCSMPTLFPVSPNTSKVQV